jgi:hypothetical protein
LLHAERRGKAFQEGHPGVFAPDVLSTSEKPSFAFLSSRILYGIRIEPDDIVRLSNMDGMT